MAITPERAAAIIREAFAPLECFAEVYDYASKVRFRVFSETDDGILKAPSLTAHQVSTCEGLREVIERARSMVEEAGHTLAPWTMPD